MRIKTGTFLVAALAFSVSLVAGPSTPAAAQTGEDLFLAHCSGCHGLEGTGGVVGRPIRGARICSMWKAIHSFILGMEHLEILTPQQLFQISEYLNSFQISGEDRYIATCLGCHGKRGEGGRVARNVQGEDTSDIIDAIFDEDAMAYLTCLSPGDVQQIAGYLDQFDD